MSIQDAWDDHDARPCPMVLPDLRQPEDPGIWAGKEGFVQIALMTDEHLTNAILFLERNCSFDQEDPELEWGEELVVFKPEFPPQYEVMIAEKERRGL